MSRRNNESGNVCVIEQDIDVYLKFGGIIINNGPSGATGTNAIQRDSVDIDRTMYIRADGNFLIARYSTLPGAPEIRFLDAMIVKEPEINPCARNTRCKQVIRYRQQSAYVDMNNDIGNYNQLHPCSLLVASGSRVYLIPKAFDRCDCANITLADVRAALNGADRNSFASATNVVVHLKDVVVAPVNGGNNFNGNIPRNGNMSGNIPRNGNMNGNIPNNGSIGNIGNGNGANYINGNIGAGNGNAGIPVVNNPNLNMGAGNGNIPVVPVVPANYRR